MIKKVLFSLFICVVFLCNSAFALDKNYYILVDKDNNKLYDYVFTNIWPSYSGYKVEIAGGKSGILDKNGKFIIEPVYGNIYEYSKDRFLINSRKIIDRNSNVLFMVEENPDSYIIIRPLWDNSKKKYLSVLNKNNDNEIIYDENFQKIVSLHKQSYRFSGYMGGYIVFDNKLFDLTSRKWVEAENAEIYTIAEYNGKKCFTIKDKNTKKYGIIDINQKNILPVLYDDIKIDDKHDLIITTKNDLKEYYNFDGKVVNNPIISNSQNKKNDTVIKSGDGWGPGYYSKDALKHPIISNILYRIPFVNQAFGISEFFGITHITDSKYTIYNDLGKKIFRNVSSDDFEHCFRFSNGNYLIYKNTVYDKTTMKKYHIKSSVKPQALNDNKFLINRNNKNLIVDINNNKIINEDYSSLKRLSTLKNENLFVIEKNGKIGIINQNGIEKVPAIYDDINNKRWYPLKVFNAKKNGKWGWIDENGTTVVDFIYDKPIYYILNNGIAIVEFE